MVNMYSRRARCVYKTKEDALEGLRAILADRHPDSWSSNWVLKEDRALHGALKKYFPKEKANRADTSISWEAIFALIPSEFKESFAPEGSKKQSIARRKDYEKEARPRALKELEELIDVESPKSFNANWIKRESPPLHRLLIEVFPKGKSGIDWDLIFKHLPKLRRLFVAGITDVKKRETYDAKKLFPTHRSAITELRFLLMIVKDGERVNPRFIRKVGGEALYRKLALEIGWEEVRSLLPEHLKDRFVFGSKNQLGKELAAIEKRLAATRKSLTNWWNALKAHPDPLCPDRAVKLLSPSVRNLFFSQDTFEEIFYVLYKQLPEKDKIKIPRTLRYCLFYKPDLFYDDLNEQLDEYKKHGLPTDTPIYADSKQGELAINICAILAKKGNRAGEVCLAEGIKMRAQSNGCPESIRSWAREHASDLRRAVRNYSYIWDPSKDHSFYHFFARRLSAILEKSSTPTKARSKGSP